MRQRKRTQIVRKMESENFSEEGKKYKKKKKKKKITDDLGIHNKTNWAGMIVNQLSTKKGKKRKKKKKRELEMPINNEKNSNK